MANPWERNWATSDTETPAVVVVAPNTPPTASAASTAAPWERNWASDEPAKAPTNTTADSTIEGVLTGAGAGFRDEVYAASKASGLPEILGGFRAPVGAARLALEKYNSEPGEASKIYDQSLEEIHARQKAAQEDHPVAFGVGQVGGSLIPASRITKAVGTGASLGGAIVRSGVAGGILGGVKGAGNSDGDLTDRAIGALEGIPVGTVIGAVAPRCGPGSRQGR